jgi:hypothetical protein
MRAEEIEVIMNELSKFKFPEANAVQRKNSTHYTNYVDQIRDWYSHAIKIKQAQSAESFADFAELLAKHIQNDPSLTGEQKKIKEAAIKDKLKILVSFHFHRHQQNINKDLYFWHIVFYNQNQELKQYQLFSIVNYLVVY